ncbi:MULTISPECIES: hypothetical protein [Psychrilyobacter]|uniref:hypothetical protein n=1 Tax=Psychrilyobacter TaxID=623282 RepID=UPI0011C0540E|nr:MULTISPECIES: hypothetical protein [Psychrilyobacter]
MPFTITLAVSLSAGTNGSLAYSAFLSQLNVYSATWSFSGAAWQNESDWVEHSWNHGDVKAEGGAQIYNIGHPHEHDTGHKSVSGGGTLKSDSATLANVSQRINLKGVDIHQYTVGNDDNERTVTVSPTTYVTGTLTITGYKLP